MDPADLEHRRRVGARIREARKAKGLSQNELAALIPETAVDGRYVSSWERGAHLPTMRYVRALAAALGVSLSWLMALENNEGPPVSGPQISDR